MYVWLPLYGPVPVLESVAATVNVKLPPAVGVPLRTPLGENVMPAGNVPLVIWMLVNGAVPPVGTSGTLYATPTGVLARVGGENVMVGGATVHA